jgi:hypothetical protein
MGNERREITINYLLSRHNSPRDLRDDALAGELIKELREVCENPKYSPINVMPSGLDAQEFEKEREFYAKMREALAPYVPAEELSEAVYAVYRAI